MLGRLAAEQMEEIGQLNGQIADLTARLDQAQAMILERDQLIAELTASLAGRYDLKALELCADAAVVEAETQIERFEGEAINWGDVGCVGAEWYVGADDNTGYRVWIEEADPAAYRLRDFIRGHLARHGFVDVDVMLEW